MAHYIDPQLWDDWKFLDFDDPTRVLWLALLTGPHRKPLPGLFRVSVGELADTLKRSVDAVETSMKRLEREGMALHDREARVVCLPNAPRYAYPPNAVQLQAWYRQWRELPPSELKFAHIPRLRACVERSPKIAEGLSSRVADVWRETFARVVVEDPATWAPERLRDLTSRRSGSPPAPPLDPYASRSRSRSNHQLDPTRDVTTGSDNVREKERYDYGNSDASEKRQNMQVHTLPSSEPLRLPSRKPKNSEKTEQSQIPVNHKSAPKSGVFSPKRTERAKPQKIDKIQKNGVEVTDNTTVIEGISAHGKLDGSNGGHSEKSVESEAVRRRAVENVSSKIPERDRLPDFCLPKARRSGSQTPP